jgi:hypothetical protein
LRRFTPLELEDLALIYGLTLRQYGEVRQAELVVIDLDGFGLLAKRKRGHVFACKGYFAHYPGKEGYYVFVTYTGPYRVVVVYLLDPGHVSPRSRFYDLYYQALGNLDNPEIGLLSRFDGGTTSGAIIEFLIDEGHLVLSKGNNSRTSRRLARRANNNTWECSPNQQANDLGWIKIPGCRHRGRVILLRTFRRDKVLYSHLFLNLPAQVLSVKEAVDLYNARQTMESMIKESRQVLWIGHLRTSHYWGLQAFIALGFLAHNLLTWSQQDVCGDTGLEDLGLKRFLQDFALTRSGAEGGTRCSNQTHTLSHHSFSAQGSPIYPVPPGFSPEERLPEPPLMARDLAPPPSSLAVPPRSPPPQGKDPVVWLQTAYRAGQFHGGTS